VNRKQMQEASGKVTDALDLIAAVSDILLDIEEDPGSYGEPAVHHDIGRMCGLRAGAHAVLHELRQSIDDNTDDEDEETDT